MLFKSAAPNQASPAPTMMGTPAASPAVFDVTTAEFEQNVIMASMQRPVIVDFWAPWCGPCKQLGPLLEKAVQAAGGAVLMAKVNIDQNQELAAALRIQSVPTVYAFFGGRPVDGFQGAVPESQIKAFIDKLVALAKQATPGALDIPAALQQGAQALAQGALPMAQQIYAQILAQDAKNAQAYVGLIRTYIAAGQIEQACAMVDHAPPEIGNQSAFAEARSALELAQMSPAAPLADLQARAEKNPQDLQAVYDYALGLYTAGQREAAIESLLSIVRKNRTWNEDAARKHLLKIFEALGPADPLVAEARRKLSTILFS